MTGVQTCALPICVKQGNTIGDISVNLAITGVTRDEINAETQRQIAQIPDQIMKGLNQHGFGIR